MTRSRRPDKNRRWDAPQRRPDAYNFSREAESTPFLPETQGRALTL
jgi:hypothetical protein